MIEEDIHKLITIICFGLVFNDEGRKRFTRTQIADPLILLPAHTRVHCGLTRTVYGNFEEK